MARVFPCAEQIPGRQRASRRLPGEYFLNAIYPESEGAVNSGSRLRADYPDDGSRAGNFPSVQGLDPATQVSRQKSLRARIEIGAVFRPRKTVAFVRVNHIDHLAVVLLDGGDNLFRLGLLDPRIVGPLPELQNGHP